MKEMEDRIPSSASAESSPTSASPMRSNLTSVFKRITRRIPSFRNGNLSPHSQRSLHGDVEQEEFQYASTSCLSSYYSVFVARLAIMVMLAILIGMLTMLTWHFTKDYTTKSINSLAYGLRYEILQRPILRMWNILNATVEITTAQVKLSEYVIRRYDNPINQAQQVELYQVMKDVTWALFASRKALNAITINYKNGFVQAFHRDHRSNNTFYIYSDLVNYSISNTHDVHVMSSHEHWNDESIHGNLSAIWYREPLDPITGERIGKPRPIPPDELINIAGPSQVPDGTASWHVSVSKFTDSPLLSAALPVWDASNESIVAVVGVTTAFYSVGQLMKELVEFHSGHIYLTSPEGYLLATSTNTPLLMNTTSGRKLMMAVDSEDPVIRQGAQWLQRVYGNKFPPGHEVHVENARLGHKQYYIDSFFLNLKRLPMVSYKYIDIYVPERKSKRVMVCSVQVGVIIIPRSYIMGKVDERAFKTLIILISASVCILVVGCVCIFILTNGVSKEMKLRAELINQLDARRRAEASSNYKSQFLANMSHELRTPMAAVIGLLDILICDDDLTNEQFATVTQIRKCSTALLRLLNNILDLSKVESGKLVLEETEFDLGRELEGLVDMFTVQCINQNVETVLDLSDDMPKLVVGDSARVVQIFANLISNSIKFTTSGHIILRGWCENSITSDDGEKKSLEKKDSRSTIKAKLKQHRNQTKRACKKENKVTLWFEVDDTGSGIDPSKWETVFESFEQADPSTTRTHGGTGLGLCIVRTFVNKMGGAIKVMPKNGPGTLMRLYLLLHTPVDGAGQQCQTEFAENNLAVLLALNGPMGRLILSQWLQKNGVFSWEASEWNELTLILQELFHARKSEPGFDVHSSQNEVLRAKRNAKDIKNWVFVIVVDIGQLDLSTEIWKEQLNFLDKYSDKAKFAWILDHDTSNAIKMELRGRGHQLMINKPLYKVKMVQILEAVIKERNNEMHKKSPNAPRTVTDGNLHECLEIDPIHFDAASSDDSDMSEISSLSSVMALKFEEKHDERITNPCSDGRVKDCMIEFTEIKTKASKCQKEQCEQFLTTSCAKDEDCSCSGEVENEKKKSLQGLRILLAEDTPVLQTVATIMLEKMGAIVVAVGDGVQAVDALKCVLNADDGRRKSPSPYDLILMDCQMPKMDGYEATKAIRRSESGTGSHIPIVALTAHAMSSDEAKCLEVGMDAYLTKPIDSKLMVATILQLTKTMS
ncbi:Signal transduction response regulator, receiver domain [Dillenia turbinata]|uniref:histidine kinase n=1 Tax=Dillenia turbinata TaxID=194707 RepID=A0AAN8UYU8_9MAGN